MLIHIIFHAFDHSGDVDEPPSLGAEANMVGLADHELVFQVQPILLRTIFLFRE